MKSVLKANRIMSSVTITLPSKVLEGVRKRAESEGKPLEEYMAEAFLKQLDIKDPEAKVELHLKLCEKYLEEAEAFLLKKDYVQASEKAWDASSQIPKALAAKEGKELRSHRLLWEYANELAERLGDGELRHLWRTANVLHQNFYECWMPPREVELSVGDVKTFIERLRALLNI
jgi:hypothetical protein